eukprot:COSAG02_NODE_2338_length_9108_cov_17.856699_5_plen_132_part_00
MVPTYLVDIVGNLKTNIQCPLDPALRRRTRRVVKAGAYYQGFAPVRDGEGPWSGTRIRDGEVRVCEVHAERLREYKPYGQTPSGGQASSAVELALVADAIRVRSGRPARPYDELVATAVLPDGAMASRAIS